jgi:diazepam-binding inhibitor (GABA receptor modulating acyl-CoA-binding protein)
MSKKSKKFLHAAEQVNKLAATPTNDELLIVYGLYKQATLGDVNISRPGFFSFREQKKWDAWDSFKGTEQQIAESKYVSFVDALTKKYGLSK